MALAVQGMYLSSTSPPQETGVSVVPSFVPGLSLDNDVSVAANLTMNWIANDLTRRGIPARPLMLFMFLVLLMPRIKHSGSGS